MIDGAGTKPPVAELSSEHEVIQKVAAGLSALEVRLSAGGSVDVALLRRVLEFLREYADRLHHGKEEVLLFPMLERRGVPAYGCPVGALLAEHQRGRALVAEFADHLAAYESDAGGAGVNLATTMKALGELYATHIWKEEYLLFPMSEKVLDKADLAELAARFAELNQETGEALIARSEELAVELTAFISQ